MTDAAKPPCPICDDKGWVCENHRDKPWGEFSDRPDACSCGAGAPCAACNPCDETHPPDMTRSGIKTDFDRDGQRH